MPVINSPEELYDIWSSYQQFSIVRPKTPFNKLNEELRNSWIHLHSIYIIHTYA